MLLSQSKYISDLIKEVRFEEASEAKTPLPPGFQPIMPSPLLETPGQYRRLIGRFLYLHFTRPDISFATQKLSQYMSKHTMAHMEAALHMLRYLKGTQNYRLFYLVQENLQLHAYSDADWANCKQTRQSITINHILEVKKSYSKQVICRNRIQKHGNNRL